MSRKKHCRRLVVMVICYNLGSCTYKAPNARINAIDTLRCLLSCTFHSIRAGRIASVQSVKILDAERKYPILLLIARSHVPSACPHKAAGGWQTFTIPMKVAMPDTMAKAKRPKSMDRKIVRVPAIRNKAAQILHFIGMVVKQ